MADDGSPPDHAFFEQAVFEGQVGHDLLQRGRLGPELLDLRRGHLAGRVPGQPLFARLEELLRPGVVQALAFVGKTVPRTVV